MIKVSQIAEKLQTGLNQALGDDSPFEFKIWCQVGKFKKAMREPFGNKSKYYINASLHSVSSSNEAVTDLTLGANDFEIDFLVPVITPKTAPVRFNEEAEEVFDDDGQFIFVDYITSVINSYFEKATAFSLTADGSTYSIGLSAGVSTTGEVDMTSVGGNYVLINVYLETFFVENGTNSKDIVVLFDNKAIPYISTAHGRTAIGEDMLDFDTLDAKRVNTSSTFVLEVQLPSTSDPITEEALDFTYSGNPNKAHFAKISWGDKVYNELLIMTDTQNVAQGISIAGITATFTKATDQLELLDFGENYTVLSEVLTSSDETECEFTITGKGIAYSCGQFYEVTTAGENTLTVSVRESDLVAFYDTTDNEWKYKVYLVFLPYPVPTQE